MGFSLSSVLDPVMSAFGAEKGSSWSEDVSWLTDEQKEGLKGSISGLENLKYKGPGGYTSGMSADDLEGFKGSSADSLRKLQGEDRLSISGVEQLRNMMAGSAAQVMPDVQALRGLGDKAWAGYDAQLAETTRGAREKMQQADIASRRGQGARGGTALQRLGSQNVMEYGRTVGGAAARAVEQSAIQRQQLALQARMGAGQLMGGLQQRQISGYGTMGQLDLGGLGLVGQDLASRRGLASQEKMFGAQHGLDVAQFSEQQAQAKNLWAQKNAQMQNQFGLDRLSQLGDISTRRTQERVEHVKEGSAGMLPGLVGAGLAAFGGPAGMAAAGAVTGAMSSGYGPSRSGGVGGGMDPMMQFAMMQGLRGGAGPTNASYDPNFGGPPGINTAPNAAGSSWWDNTTSAVGNWWDNLGSGNTGGNIDPKYTGMPGPRYGPTLGQTPTGIGEFGSGTRLPQNPNAANQEMMGRGGSYNDWNRRWARLQNQRNTTEWNPTAWDPFGDARNPDGTPVKHLFSWW